jgi:hypothetical protein
MTRIDFNTGRFYGPKGQEITCVKIGDDVLMVDHSRMIDYNIPNCPLQVITIMERYDKNFTEQVVSKDLRELAKEIQAGYEGIEFEGIEL